MAFLIRAALLAFAALPGAAAMAQEAEPVCPRDAQPLPAALAGWPQRTALAAGVRANDLAAATLTPGKGVDLALRPTPEVSYALRPERPGGSVSHGGMVAFAAPEAGTYRVALGSAAWIDVVHDGQAMTSVAHGRGPACSGVRKMVDFALQPGTYILQIVGNGSAALPVMVARLP